ncbi:MAG TPA: UPF0182 family protein [Candidatus Dormibacteraeota bacterium]|jgi:uncharacterized membrane protein (UPF0182 family)|nr:UPF0182 family protein [Candidatus Dormibacteraeota bacterium]
MSAFGFDPEQIFARRRSRPRIVRPPGQLRRRIIIFGVIAAIIVLLIVIRWLLGLRADYLYYKSVGHTNVFWTPLIAHIVLFFIGFAIVAVVFGAAVVGCAMAAANLDRRGRRIALWTGAVIAVLAGIIGGSTLSGEWQDILVWTHSVPFGATDPVFHLDYSFFVFTLPAVDDLMGLLWGAVILGLLAAIAMAVVSITVMNAPEELPLPLEPPPGRSPEDALRAAVLTGGIGLAAVFVLAALGAHFGVYHLATSTHTQGGNYVGLDATQRAVIQPVLGFLQVLALVLAVVALVLVAVRWRHASTGTAIAFGSLLGGWLLVAGLAQAIPAAVYQATSVGPNEQTAQTPTIRDFLTTSRYAWAIQDDTSNPQVENRAFGTPHAPTLSDLESDVGTLQNVRIQDPTQLPDTLAQIDRSRSYQTYSTITVDRYPAATGGDTEVMLGPREIAEGDITNPSFVNTSLNFTHGYGVTAVSVSAVGGEGKPQVLVGQQPMTQVSPTAPSDLSFGGSTTADPSIYCGLDTTQNVVSGTTQPEFNYPSGSGDSTVHADSTEVGIPITNPIDKLALSLQDFGGFNLFLNNSLTANSRALVNRQIKSRITSLAPFLTVDSDPYIVVDPTTGHLEWIADAYVKSSLFPEAYQQSDGTSYMRNAVKAVIDAKTCAIKLYAVDMNEPITAAWNAIYPGLLTPLEQISPYLRSHLRYPEDLFNDQAQAYASVHIHQASVFYQGADLFNIAQENLNGTNQATTAYYVEMTLPGTTSPQFVLLQTFSPGASGGGVTANNMTAWLAAECDYTGTNEPKLVAVRLNNADNVLGPLQFDNNINTNPQISSEITLLSHNGSVVTLGNVIVLPFNNDSFLYIRPLYVTAASNGGTAFPQLQEVIVGDQSNVQQGTSFSAALQALLGTTQPIPGLNNGGTTTPTPSPSPSTSPTASPSPGVTPTPVPTGSIQQQIIALDGKIVADNSAAEAALMAGNFTLYGADEAKVQADLTALQKLLAQQAAPSPSP